MDDGSTPLQDQLQFPSNKRNKTHRSSWDWDRTTLLLSTHAVFLRSCTTVAHGAVTAVLVHIWPRSLISFSGSTLETKSSLWSERFACCLEIHHANCRYIQTTRVSLNGPVKPFENKRIDGRAFVVFRDEWNVSRTVTPPVKHSNYRVYLLGSTESTIFCCVAPAVISLQRFSNGVIKFEFLKSPLTLSVRYM